MGEVQSEELKKAISEASAARGKEVDLTLICVNLTIGSWINTSQARPAVVPYGSSTPKGQTVA